MVALGLSHWKHVNTSQLFITTFSLSVFSIISQLTLNVPDNVLLHKYTNYTYTTLQAGVLRLLHIPSVYFQFVIFIVLKARISRVLKMLILSAYNL